MSDSVIYNEAIEVNSLDRPFVKKEIVKAYDTQSQNYNGQVRIDTASIFNSSKFAGYGEGFLEVPWVIAMKSSEDITTYSVNGFMCGLKNGFTQIINSIVVDFNGTNVVQLQEFTNMYIHFKQMTSWSQDDLNKYGSSLGFFPDTATSYNYSDNQAGNNGNGLSNNVVTWADLPNFSVAGYTGEAFNNGFLQRLRVSGFDPTAGLGGVIAKMTSASVTDKVGKSYFTATTDTGADKVYYWKIMATIRLRDMHSFFENIPILKGGLIKLTINYNAASFKITNTAASVTALTAWGIANTGNLSITGHTNPLLVASAAAKNPNYGIGRSIDKNLFFSCNIYSTTVDGTTVKNDMSNVVTLYVPVYTFDAVYLDNYLSLNKTKTFTYRDIYSKLYTAKSGSFNETVIGSITNPKALIIIPVLNAASNGPVAISPVQSPFDTCPATTSPLISLTNFQVQVSGLNLWADPQTYEWDSFLNEFRGVNCMNGGSTTGFTSGLLDQLKWSTAYKYYYADISRRLEQDDLIPKSIQISGTIENSLNVNLYVFVEVERSITIDVSTGEILNISGSI